MKKSTQITVVLTVAVIAVTSVLLGRVGRSLLTMVVLLPPALIGPYFRKHFLAGHGFLQTIVGTLIVLLWLWFLAFVVGTIAPNYIP